MPRLSTTVNAEVYNIIKRLASTNNIKISAAISLVVSEYQKHAQDRPELRTIAHVPRAGASSPSAQKKINKYNRRTEAVGSESSEILPYCKDNKNSQKALRTEPVFMPDPDNWEPNGDFQATWCAAKGYDYAIALEIFRDKFKADPQRCADWNSKWKYFVQNGYLQGAKFSSRSNYYGEADCGPANKGRSPEMLKAERLEFERLVRDGA